MRRIVMTGLLLGTVLSSLPAHGQAGKVDLTVPARFRAMVFVLNAPVSGSARLAITIDRWSTREEKVSLVEALKSGMEKMTVGYLQVNSGLRWPIRVASTWPTDKGQAIRLATNRPIYFGEFAKGMRSMDYPIGLIEFTLPPEGRGEGTLVMATRPGFDKEGRIEVRSMPSNTGAQKLTNVEREPIKDKKK
jgi:hypothetical protein